MVRWLKLSLVVVMGCGFLAMMIYALVNRDEISSSQIEPPLITPPSEPLKRRPDQPGGMQIPNRDKLVFDLLDSSNTTLGGTGVDAMREVVAEPASSTVTVAEDAAPVTITTPATSVEEPKVEIKPVEVAAPVSPKVEVKLAETPAPVVKTPEKVVEKPVEKPVEKTAAKPTTGGKWGVQLAAVNTVADGNALATKAMKDFSVLSGLSPKVSQVPGAGKYRVQLFGFKDRDAAAAACAKLAGKQGCFPVGGK